MFSLTSSIVRIAFIVLGFGLGAVPDRAHSQDASFDPQSLVGQWVGTWTETGARGLSGSYHMTIEKVEGNQVRGNAEMAGRRVPVPPFRVSGTLSGNRLTYGRRVKTELTIEGNRMTGGTSGANDDVRIELTRKP